MGKYQELISRSLIDFEEIKFILANNNIKLVTSYQIHEKVFLKEGISIKNSNYQTIIDNSLKISLINDKKYLTFVSNKGYMKDTSSIQVVDENECINFLNHIGYFEQYILEADVYVYSDGAHKLYIINLINIGLYLSVRSEECSIDELKEILTSFNIPYDENECNESIEKIFVNKIRRQIR